MLLDTARAACVLNCVPPERDKSKLPALTAGQRVFERFYLKRVLGEGGMGVVWLAHDRVLEQQIALKFLADHLLDDRSAVERLKHETRRNLKLSHPHIVRIHDFLQDAQRAAIMMEYVDGWSLSTMKIDKPRQIFGVQEIRPWLLELCDALDYAHHKVGIVHHDLNPSNLMLNARGQLKITDFGMARNLRRTSTHDFVDLRVVGTDVYMSPQQWSGQPPTVADDIYSIGATIYELLTSKPPFYEGNIQDQVFEAAPPLMTERLAELDIRDVEIPASYEKAVAACLAKNPADRPGRVNELAAQLGLIETTAPPGADAPSPGSAAVEIETPAEQEAAVVSPPALPVEAAVSNGAFLLGMKGILAACALAILLGVSIGFLAGKISLKNPAMSGLAARAPGIFPQTGKQWQNSLGMRFVPVPGVPGLFCIWETRVRDFDVYVAELGRAPGNDMLSLDSSNNWKELGHSWSNPEFPQNENHPVVGVNWNEAAAFCDWLTIRERAAGWIATNQGYRLPTSAEWLLAAGTNQFTWGNTWPPPKGSGNFAGEEIRARLPAHPYITGFNDNFAGTSPVGSFTPNTYGIFDLAGNVAEYCADRDPKDRARRPWLAGGSWQDSTPAQLALTNLSHVRLGRRVSDCGFRVILDFNLTHFGAGTSDQ